MITNVLYVIYEKRYEFLSGHCYFNDIVYFTLDKKKAEEMLDFLKRYSPDSEFSLEEKELS